MQQIFGTHAVRRALPTFCLPRPAGYSFGCYTPDSWHVAPRYYGSGETFVFQLEVRHCPSVLLRCRTPLSRPPVVVTEMHRWCPYALVSVHMALSRGCNTLGVTAAMHVPQLPTLTPAAASECALACCSVQPFRVAYPWRSLSKEKNDFFQYGTPECLAVGGLGHFAIWLDSELLHVGVGLGAGAGGSWAGAGLRWWGAGTMGGAGAVGSGVPGEGGSVAGRLYAYRAGSNSVLQVGLQEVGIGCRNQPTPRTVPCVLLPKSCVPVAPVASQGSSGTCGTFGSPCLAAAEDFKIQAVELWQATA